MVSDGQLCRTFNSFAVRFASTDNLHFNPMHVYIHRIWNFCAIASIRFILVCLRHRVRHEDEQSYLAKKTESCHFGVCFVGGGRLDVCSISINIIVVVMDSYALAFQRKHDFIAWHRHTHTKSQSYRINEEIKIHTLTSFTKHICCMRTAMPKEIAPRTAGLVKRFSHDHQLKVHTHTFYLNNNVLCIYLSSVCSICARMCEYSPLLWTL